jgi:uncharacterized protein YbaR (Trm112 family)
MKTITSKNEFETLLQAEKAIVFLFFEWSGQAVQSREVVEQWESDPMLSPTRIGVSVHQLIPEEHPYSHEWVEDSAREAGGGGAVVWIRNRSIVGHIPNAARTGVQTLAQLTHDYLVLGKIQPPPTPSVPRVEAKVSVDPELLKIMCCPETHQPIALAEAPLIEKLNQQIAAGQLKNRAGRPVNEKIDGGLVREDKKFLYPIRADIPVMLIDEAIPLAA